MTVEYRQRCNYDFFLSCRGSIAEIAREVADVRKIRLATGTPWWYQRKRQASKLFNEYAGFCWRQVLSSGAPFYARARDSGPR